MTLPKRKSIPPEDKRGPWRSPKHRSWLTKTFACAMCGSPTNVAAAHVRKGGDGGMGMKPSDWLCVPLCDGPQANIHGQLGCHNRQHAVGEDTFWEEYEKQHGQSVDDLIASLNKASPKTLEIARVKKARGQ